MQNRDLLHAAIASVTGKDDFPFEPTTRIIEDIGLDSTSAMEVLMELEDNSTLEIDPNELSMDDFQTVDAFVKFLDRNIGN